MTHNFYDVNALVGYCVQNHVNISPQDRLKWVMFCNALKVLDYDEFTFVALSNDDAADEARRVWRNEKDPWRYTDKDRATAKIIYLAQVAGVDLAPFREKLDVRPAWEPAPPRPPRVLPPTEFVDPAIVKHFYGAGVEKSVLSQYLCHRFGQELTRRTLDAYYIGHTAEFGKGLGTAFPYVNAAGYAVDIKLMAYNADGHRRKEGYSVNWHLALQGKSNRRAPWCLFGEHLAARRADKRVAIVESEKTALICDIAAPDYVWCAVGSLHNLNARILDAVRGREIYLFPDVDGIAQWEAKAAALKAQGFNVYLCSQFIKDNARGPKDDIGDIILYDN